MIVHNTVLIIASQLGFIKGAPPNYNLVQLIFSNLSYLLFSGI